MTCPENSSIVTLNAHLNHFQSQRQILEAQLIKQDRAQTEIQDFQFQLENVLREINDLTKDQQQSNDNIDDFDKISLKYNQVLDCMGKLKQDNHDLQCDIQCKTIINKSTIDKIKKLEINKEKTVEEINELQEKIKIKLASSKEKKSQQINLEKAVMCKMDELQKTCQEMANVQANMECKNKQLLEMQWKSNEIYETLKNLKAECKRRDVNLTELKKFGQKWLVKADKNADKASIKLTDKRVMLADWTAERERTQIANRQMKTEIDTENCHMRSVMKVLCDETEKSSSQLANITFQLTAALSNNQRLLVASKKVADQLADLMDKLDCMEQRKCHERLIQSLEKVKGDTEITLLKNEKAVKDHKLFLATAEVEELRRSSNYCLQMTEKTK